LKTIRQIFSFFRKDFLEEVSYRTAFLMQIGGVFISVTLWYFIAGFLKPLPGKLPGLPGVPYFAFLLVGIAFYHYLSSALGSFANFDRCPRQVLVRILGAMHLNQANAEFICHANIVARTSTNLMRGRRDPAKNQKVL